jgi:hypothetical protein
MNEPYTYYQVVDRDMVSWGESTIFDNVPL